MFYFKCPSSTVKSLPHQHLLFVLEEHTFKWIKCLKKLMTETSSFQMNKTADSDWQQLSSVTLSCLCSHCFVCMAFCGRGHRNKESSWGPKAQMNLCLLSRTGDSLSFKTCHRLDSDRIVSLVIWQRSFRTEESLLLGSYLFVLDFIVHYIWH